MIIKQVSSCRRALLLENALSRPTLSPASTSTPGRGIWLRVGRDEYELDLPDEENYMKKILKLNVLLRPRDESCPPTSQDDQAQPQPLEDLDPRIFAPTGDIYRSLLSCFQSHQFTEKAQAFELFLKAEQKFDYIFTQTIAFAILTIEKTIWQLPICIYTIWDTDYNSDNWEPEFMTIFVTWQLIVTLDSIRNSCDVLG